MGSGVGRLTNHSEYYLSDGSVSFVAGNTLFRVHRSFFDRESEFFRQRFAEGDPRSGTDETPFSLDVKPEEFEQLLWVWYDREYSYQRKTKDDWVTILRLATRWGFAKIKVLAVRELEALELSPAERISIYNAHAVDGEQLLSPCIELCRSPSLPTAADGRLIPMDILIKVLQAREDAQLRAVELGHESPTSASLEDEDLREILSRHLGTGLSLNPRSNGTSTGSGGQAPDLNGERARPSTAVTLGEPHPHRTGQSTGKPPFHLNSSSQTVGEGKESSEKERLELSKQDKAKEAREKERVEQKPQRSTFSKPWGN